MGMLGAMAGFGKGLQDYSTLLNHKADLDWQEQQARIKYEREQSMEALRNQNNRAIMYDTNKLAQDRQSEQNRYEEGRYKTKLDDSRALLQQEHDFKIDEITDPRVIEAKNQIAKNTYGAMAAAELSKAKGLLEESYKLDKTKRTEKLAALRQTDGYINAPDNEKSLMETSIMEPEVARTILEVQKLNSREVPYEQQRLAVKEGVDRYFKDLSDDQRKIFKADLENKLGRSFTDMEAANVMGRHNLELTLENMGGKKSPKKDTTELPSTYNKRGIDLINQKIAKGELNYEDAKAELHPSQWKLLKEPNGSSSKKGSSDSSVDYSQIPEGEVTNYGYMGSTLRPGMFKAKEFDDPNTGWLDEARNRQNRILEEMKNKRN